MSTQSARLSMAFSNVGHFFTHLLMMLYPTVVLALEGRWGLTYGELLSLSLAGYILYGVAALPAGWLGDKWSAEGMMILFFLGSGGAAVATGLASGPLGIASGLALIGVFGSIYHPVGIAWLVRNAANRGGALGWNGIFGSLGIGLAALIAGALTQFISWRAAFIVPGALSIIIGLVLALAVRAGIVVAAKADRKPEPEASRADVMRAFIVLSITMLCAGLVSQAFIVALPKIFAERLTGLTDGGILGAGGFVTLVFLLASATQIVGGWLADRYSLKSVYIWSWAVQLPLFLIAVRLVNLPLLAAMMAVECFNVLATPAENSLLVRYTPARWRATAFGAKFVLALGVSSAGVPLVAITYDRTGDFLWLFLALAVLAAIIAFSGLFLPGERRAPAPTRAIQPAE
ncbi:MAG TPA: MFS transporter [Stellaceae bacterium]|nr:MFS transporter [Stellaceae bacterium]